MDARVIIFMLTTRVNHTIKYRATAEFLFIGDKLQRHSLMVFQDLSQYVSIEAESTYNL